jgi:hypothetical protein
VEISNRFGNWQAGPGREQLTPMLRDFLDRAADVTTDAYVDACAKAEAAKTALLAWFDGIDTLLRTG